MPVEKEELNENVEDHGRTSNEQADTLEKRTYVFQQSARLGNTTRFFDKVNTELGPFTLDACASEQNAKCNKFFTAKDDGLTQDWYGNNVFVNPPYGRGIDKWIKKAYEESQKVEPEL